MLGSRFFQRSLSSLQLNARQCKSYLIFNEKSREALLLDPIRDNLTLYLSVLAYKNLNLKYVVDSHSHADHISAGFRLRNLTGTHYVMHESAPAPQVDLWVKDGDTLALGDEQVKVLHTPGHTPDSICLYTGDAVFTGDTLFIGGCGRTDFSGGDPSDAYDSITQKLFTLPGSTVVYPSHDYRFNTSSTIDIEKTTNPRLANKTKQQFIDIMNNLGLPLPEKIMEALQINTSAIDDNQINLPTYSQLNSVRQVDPEGLKQIIASGEHVPVIDVRESNEFLGTKLPGLPGSINIPLKELVGKIDSLKDFKTKKVVVVCRAGIRSATAASVMAAYGFENVVNLKHGLLSMKKV